VLELYQPRLHGYLRITISSLKEAFLINAIDVVPAILGLILFRAGVLEAFGLILLLESSGLMLLGGALSFTGQEGIRRLASVLSKVDMNADEREIRKNEMKAGLYVLTGVMLFAESSVLAALTL
jgi:hypothetical protein